MSWLGENVLDHIPNICDNKECNGIYLIYIYVLILGIGYFALVLMFLKGNKRKDYLNTVIYSDKYLGNITIWAISHFTLYFILGLLFPECDLIIIFVSFLWEGIEEFLGHVFENNSIVMPFNKIQKDVKYKRWWHGSLRDVLYNLSGYYLAKFLVQYYDINIKIPGINQF